RYIILALLGFSVMLGCASIAWWLTNHSSSRPSFSQSTCNKIQPEMEWNEVMGILRVEPGDYTTRPCFWFPGGYATDRCVWLGDEGRIEILFDENGKVFHAYFVEVIHVEKKDWLAHIKSFFSRLGKAAPCCSRKEVGSRGGAVV